MRPSTKLGTDFSCYRAPLRGVPQWGALLPLLLLLHVRRAAKPTEETLMKTATLPGADSRLLMQVFADDVSAAIGHENREMLVKLAWLLRETLFPHQRGLTLDVRIPKRDNLFIELLIDQMLRVRHNSSRPLNKQHKAQNRQRM